ncbi:aldo/keto reductase [Luteimonas deserti]|uniref:aldo/keto reductase n=1 Tax=Luteimonas deserti TaxID=2752306 RepID=UPI002E2D00C4|nr:aldo/keto reductase [Luteimonas deserti]
MRGHPPGARQPAPGGAGCRQSAQHVRCRTPVDGALEAPLTALAELQQRGLVRHVGLSNVTRRQVEDAARICDIVCVQNLYNLVPREDDALIDQTARRGITYVPFSPLVDSRLCSRRRWVRWATHWAWRRCSLPSPGCCIAHRTSWPSPAPRRSRI